MAYETIELSPEEVEKQRIWTIKAAEVGRILFREIAKEIQTPTKENWNIRIACVKYSESVNHQV